MISALTKANDRLVEALNNFKAEQNRQVSSSEEIARLREELKTEELQQLAHSVKKSLKDEEESDQKFRTAAFVLNAEHVICCAEFNKLQAQLQPDHQPPLEEEETTAAKLRSRNLLEKVKQLTEEVEILQKKFCEELEDLARSLLDLSSDLAVLSGLVLVDDVLEKVFRYLDPASVKAVSLVSR